MKITKLLALLMATLLCLTACGKTQAENSDTPKATPAAKTETTAATETPETADVPEEVNADAQSTPRPGSNIPDATTTEAPTPEGETYQTAGLYLGMADSNLMVIIEENPEDGQMEKSYQISPEIDLDAMGITEGNKVDITYTVDENGIKSVQSVSLVLGE